MVLIVAILKPFAYVWLGLNFIDDLSLLIRLGRLGASVVPFPRRSNKPQNMCGLCDDVVGDLLAGTDGISAIPCGAACFGLKGCIKMCEKVQETSETSTEFPCVAAGFCDPISSGYVDSSDINCRPGAFFSCHPKQYCRRRREGFFKLKCELRPGIGRWNGMKSLASLHTVAVAEGLKNQLYCGEEGAGQYCIAKPRGAGLVADWIGLFISLVIGGYKSIVAIETPGGNDDRQWLTFWLIFAVWLFLEGFLLRIILSKVPLYYEAKLACLVWLIWRSGAEVCYRKLRSIVRRIFSGKFMRRILQRKENGLWSEASFAKGSIDVMRKLGGQVVEAQLACQQQQCAHRTKFFENRKQQKFTPNEFWAYGESETDFNQCLAESIVSNSSIDRKGYDASSGKRSTTAENETEEQLYQLSKYLLSSEGVQKLEDAPYISDRDRSLLLERAAEVLSFQPRYLVIRVVGSIAEPRGELPVIEDKGEANPYVLCQLVPTTGSPYPHKGVKSRTASRTCTPFWNQKLEIPLLGGTLDSDGYYRNGDVMTTVLNVTVLDARVGGWSHLLHVYQWLILVGTALLILIYVQGVMDPATKQQKQILSGVVSFILFGYAIGYVMAVMRRSDDEIIGFCTVPLGILLDQKRHTVLLTLHPSKADGYVKPNAVGGYGVIRFDLMLSEH